MLESRNCHDLVVWSSNEKYVLLDALAKAYLPPNVDRRCVTVTVKKVASGVAEFALRYDQEVDGTRPHVWSPAALTWAVLLSQHRKERGVPDIVPLAKGPSLAQSPLVIAMPERLANALTDCRTEIGWSDILEVARNPQACPQYTETWGRLRLAKTDPTVSTSGLHALISTFNAGARVTRPLTIEEIRNSEVQKFVKGVEDGVLHYGDSVSAFLETLWEEDFRGAALSYFSAIAVEEKQVWEYNRGNPSSLECARVCPKLPPREKLKAIYPEEGSLMADHPYIVLTGKWVSDAHREAASGFLRWVQNEENHKRFLDEGFRDAARLGDPLVLRAPLFDARGVRVVSTSQGPELAEMQTSWSQLRKRANIILAFDVGTSMNADVPEQNTTKLELVKRAAQDAMTKLTEEDAVSVWAFSARPAEPYRELTPLAPLGSRATVARGLAALAIGTGNRQLYATIRASVDRLRSSFDKDRINAVVVVSDGDDHRPGSPEFYALLDYLRDQPEDQRIRVFTVATVARDPSADSALGQIAQSSKGRKYDASDPLDITGVLRDVISNF